ncbi:HYR domain-containing protein, partial [Arthrobacter sp. N199823]|uniref:HYR domain-containing protein n=1 Tax=Arthrobacter sp. N199823 TaxID=2058895 RepID=UPI0011AFEE5C
DELQVTPAYWGIVDPSRLPARPADVLPPRIADQSDIRAVSNGASGVKVNYSLPSAIDTLDGPVQLTCTPAPGTRFPVGTTTVTCTATDRVGNTRTTSFDVIVTRKQAGRPRRSGTDQRCRTSS